MIAAALMLCATLLGEHQTAQAVFMNEEMAQQRVMQLAATHPAQGYMHQLHVPMHAAAAAALARDDGYESAEAYSALANMS
jgi:hypothetical protein